MEPDALFPGNDVALRKLHECVASGEAIAFVGAGASAGLYPLWDELIQLLAKEAVDRGLATDADRSYLLRTADRSPQQAVRAIKERLGRQLYGAVLREVFGPRRGTDENLFTNAHAALLGLPFRGYVTTNYDPGLLEARLAVRPDVGATGYATWKDPDTTQRWFTGDIFEERACPILYAHGTWERSETIVLGAGEYREAYGSGLFRELVQKLWSQERLVFVGFGFSDPWFNMIADEVLTLTSRETAAAPRHVALVAMPENEEYSAEIRRHFQDAYNAEVALYPVAVAEQDGVRAEDHALLVDVLRGIPTAAVPTATRARPEPVPDEQEQRPMQKWVHETTEDDRYVARPDLLGRLDRWAEDPEVRAIAVTGMGGLGKTSLIGTWLKNAGGDRRRAHSGLFFWSFYSDQRVESFFDELNSFVATVSGVPSAKDAHAADRAAAAIRKEPLIIVADGLEVLQEAPGEGSSAYGEFLDFELRTFFDAACRPEHRGLIILTSRFPFADLTPYLGTTLRVLQLEHLLPPEGAEVLERSGAGGTEEERLETSRRLNGHPLALRILAATLTRGRQEAPAQLGQIAFDELDLQEGEPLEAKVQRLLGFYEAKLPRPWALVLGVVSLFVDPVPLGTVVTLAGDLLAAESSGGTDPEDVAAAVDSLCDEGLLMREHDSAGNEVYACHPVIRSHFRKVLLARHRGAAAEAAALLTGSPRGVVSSIDDTRPVLNAIALLLEAGDFEQADSLYMTRLENGRIFQRIPAARDGTRCALGFVGDEERRNQCRTKLSVRRLSFFLNSVGIFASYAGELETADRFYRESEAIDRAENDDLNVGVGLINRADLLVYAGRLGEAAAAATEGVRLLRPGGTANLTVVLALLGWALGLRGRVKEALEAFEEADELERATDPDSDRLYSRRGVQYADLLARLGRSAEARQFTEANMRVCESYEWHADIALCLWLLGRLDVAEGREEAGPRLARAEETIRSGHMLSELPPVLIARAEFHRRRSEWAAALRCVDDALDIAGPRRLQLQQADALVLRGAILLDAFQSGSGDEIERAKVVRVLDDGEAGLALASALNYPWAERDAHLLLDDVHRELDQDDRARHHRREAEALANRLRAPEPPPSPD